MPGRISERSIASYVSACSGFVQPCHTLLIIVHLVEVRILPGSTVARHQEGEVYGRCLYATILNEMKRPRDAMASRGRSPSIPGTCTRGFSGRESIRCIRCFRSDPQKQLSFLMPGATLGDAQLDLLRRLMQRHAVLLGDRD